METENKMSLLAHEAFTLADIVSSVGRAVNIENDPECKVNIGFAAMTEHKDVRGGTAMLELEVGIGPHDSPLLIKKRACENLERRRRGQINEIRNCTDKLAEIGRELRSIIGQVNSIAKKCCRSNQRCRCETVTSQLQYVTTKRARQSQDRARSCSRNRSSSRTRSPGRGSPGRARSSFHSSPRARRGYNVSAGSGRARSKTRNRSVSRDRVVLSDRSSDESSPVGRQVKEYSASPDRQARPSTREVIRGPTSPGRPGPARPADTSAGRQVAVDSNAIPPGRTVVLVEEEDHRAAPGMIGHGVEQGTLNQLVGAPATPLDYEPADIVREMEVDRAPPTNMSWDPTDLQESLDEYEIDPFTSVDDRSIHDVDDSSIETLSMPGLEPGGQEKPGKAGAGNTGGGEPAGSGKVSSQPPAPPATCPEPPTQKEVDSCGGFWLGYSAEGGEAIESAKNKISISARDLSSHSTVLTVEMLHARYSYTNVLMRGEREFGPTWSFDGPDLNHSQLVTEAKNLDRSRVYKICLNDTMSQFRRDFNSLGWKPIDSTKILTRETVVRVRVAEILTMKHLELLRLDCFGKDRPWDDFMKEDHVVSQAASMIRLCGVDNTMLEDEEYCLPNHPAHVRDQVQPLRARELLHHLIQYIAVRCGERMQMVIDAARTHGDGGRHSGQPGGDNWIFNNEFRVGIVRGAAASELGGLNILLADLPRLQAGVYL